MLAAFGNRLRDERIRTRKNQVDFAELGGARKSSQINYEAGKTAPSVEYLLRLEQHGVDIGYVLTGRRSDGGFSADQGLLFDLFGKLSARERDAVMHLMMILAGQTVSTADLAQQSREARAALHDPGIAFRRNETE